jgi:hypothetical protein
MLLSVILIRIEIPIALASTENPSLNHGLGLPADLSSVLIVTRCCQWCGVSAAVDDPGGRGLHGEPSDLRMADVRVGT